MKEITRDALPDFDKPQGHKYDHGHALVLSGGVGKGGAARLAARAALRMGAGAVTLGCPPAALIENAAQLNAVMLTRVADAEALEKVLEAGRFDALCLGPGLGTGDREAALVRAALRADGLAICLDADALTLLGRDADVMALLHDRCILTPHAGEFARMFPDLDAAGEGAVAAARRCGATVLLKGQETVIADPARAPVVHRATGARAAPWLATAGAGDVLAGLITGLLARGFDPTDAGAGAAWLHCDAALRFGPGLIAEDLPEALPAVLRALRS
ncbi:NAD(P)H-hydrate dehydratase [Salipiger sp. IMCC34102]|uniref:NAD(P)H-hydrate dehydratase n=1 Tax=Salipiger sp. IMCC34102 TaxID=2510647 RepID=UPI00101D35FF|nr:NAD(P)H-hydrate dehydratase [Salipiger sp. IMCC34102]RYH03394.1 NAD(P)H-hydrate dehydratase [Salipiger sp. IMCC34102]